MNGVERGGYVEEMGIKRRTVGSDSNEELLLGVKLGRIGKRSITDLVERIRRVGDKFTKENLLVGVKGVDDKVEKLECAQRQKWFASVTGVEKRRD